MEYANKDDYTPVDNKIIRVGDILKYIGPSTNPSGSSRRAYDLFKRRNIIVYDFRTNGSKTEIYCMALSDFEPTFRHPQWWISIKQGNWARVGFKDFDLQRHDHAKRMVTKSIKGFSKAYKRTLSILKTRVDFQLDKLQLHHKMNILRDLSKEEKVILELIYGDADESFKKLLQEEQIEESKVS